ncbi:MAG TPA: DUF4157 domain-containing protein [Kofleriaceae bacterium]|nr:DUF4157 domain-containing protein [Kofleriaceae bacterium]
MDLQLRGDVEDRESGSTSAESSTPGKATQVQRIAEQGVSGSGGALPFADQIGSSFGPAHADTVQGIRAHTGGAATAASEDIGAKAYATGNNVAFAGTPDLHTAAHEAAHVVQQRQGVHLKGGVGEAGDPYERHADAVADRVSAGLSAASLLGDAGGASAAPAVQLHPDDDWAPERKPKKQTAHDFDAVIGMDPLEEDRKQPLGSVFQQKYFISNESHAPRSGMKYEWSQQLDGRKTSEPELVKSIDKQHGTSGTSTFKARAFGDRTLKTSLWTTDVSSSQVKEHHAPDVHIDVPLPKVAHVGLDSTSAKWGQRPVLDEMNLGDDLIVTTQYDDLAIKEGEGKLRLEGNDFTQKQPAKLVAPGTLRTVLAPVHAGASKGRLMLEALDHFSVSPANVEVNVHDPSDEADSGPQPSKSDDHSLADNAVEQALGAWDMLTEQRRTAVHQVMMESQKVDPPPPAPWWHALLKAAVEIALASLTGGIAAGIAGAVEAKFLEHISNAAVKEGVKEFAKTFVEESLNKTIEAAHIGESEGGKKEGGEKGDAEEGAPKKGLPSIFLGVEMTALALQAHADGNFHRTHLRHQVDALEKKEKTAGVRYAMSLDRAITEQAKSGEVEKQQYIHSFQQYNNLLARMSLGTNAKDKSDVGQLAKAGTNLGGLVAGGAANLTPTYTTRMETHHDEFGSHREGTVHKEGGEGPEKVAGVLRLELQEKSGNVKIKRALLPGVTSKDFAETVALRTLRELAMNVIGIIDQHEKGAVVGRNEAGQYYGSSPKSDVLDRIAHANTEGPLSNEDVAKLILDKQLGGERVKPDIES